MIHFLLPPPTATLRFRRSERASARVIALLLLLVLGLGAGVYFYLASPKRDTTDLPASADPVLSDATKAALQGLAAPVELRFYVLLDPATVTNALPAFADRVDKLLSAYEREGAGRITVSRKAAFSPEATAAASKDGLKAFNVDKGEPSYLGIAVAQKDRKETLAQLAPEWESALESDLTRAIGRVANLAPPAPPSPEKARTEESALEVVKATFPDPAAVTVEEGNRRLRELSMKEFQDVTKELNAQVDAARQRLQQTMDSGTAADQAAARQQLQEAQAGGSRKLQQIAADAQARMLAWQKLKGVTAPPPGGHGHPPVTKPGR